MGVLESSPVSLLVVAVVASGGLFLVVTLGGLLSSLITLGALEISFRAKIQKSVLAKYFRLKQNKKADDNILSLSRYEENLRSYLSHKYKNKPESDVKKYINSLIKLESIGALVPTLAQMDPESLYRLHYRQICGQFQVVVNNEAMRRADASVYTPMIDILTFLSIQHNSVLQGNLVEIGEAHPGRKRRSDSDWMRYELDIAMREIDGIQAVLGSSLSKETFPYVLMAWSILYIPIFMMTALSYYSVSFSSLLFEFTFSSLLGIVWISIKFIFVAFIAFLIGLSLALGSAVFGAVAFTWLDRILASK